MKSKFRNSEINKEAEARYVQMAKQFEAHRAAGGTVFNFKFIEVSVSKSSDRLKSKN